MNIIADFDEEDEEDDEDEQEIEGIEEEEEEFLGDCPHCRGSGMGCSDCLMTEW